MANSAETVTSVNTHIEHEESFKVQKEHSKPCLKHAAEILAESPSIEKPNKQFCENCSQSMLSYIFLIQDALDNLARKIYGGESKNCCLQCLRQESRIEINTIGNSESTARELQKETSNELTFQSSTDMTILKKEDVPGIPINENNVQKPARKASIRRNSRRLSREQKEYENMNSSRASLTNENNVDKQAWKLHFLYDLSLGYNVDSQTPRSESNDFSKNVVIKVNKEQCINEPAVIHCFKEKKKSEDQELSNDISTETVSSNDQDDGQTKSPNILHAILANTHQVVQDNSPPILNSQNNEVVDDPVKNNSVHNETPLLIESIRNCNTTKYEAKPLENSFFTNGDHNFIRDDDQISTKKQNTSEAFVTICRNNSEVLGCLVLGCSLQLCRSSKTLCVLVLDEVDTKFKAVLSSVFNVVETVTSLNSANSTIPTRIRHFLDKLSIWRLSNFSKCVFLNPDTLVIRNCDELFQCDELSAVPDTGWPDCFNTGVFVFVPSFEKFSQLVELAEKQEHDCDGEDMVLNSFFNSWGRDISKKLSFIYNLVDNASYTYAPAFHRFGHNVKIVQFTGSHKPWQVKFCSHTDQIYEVTGVHPNFTRFFHEWISIFRVAVLRLLSQDINSKVLSQYSIAAEDILQFIEPDKRQEIPNFISYSNNGDFRIMDSQTNSSEKNQKGIYKVFSKLQTEEQKVEHAFYNTLFTAAHSTPILIPSIGIAHSEQNGQCTLDGTEMLAEISKVESGYDRKNLDLPGSIIGDYQGMKIWEQGQMDYVGCDNSENIIKRLQFLMDQPQYRVSGIDADRVKDTKIAINQCI